MNELLAYCPPAWQDLAFVFRVGQSWVTNPHGRIICILSDKLQDKKMSRQCTHSFYLHKKKKKRTKEHIVTGTTMCSFSSLRLYIIWVQKVIFVQCCLTFLFFSLPPPLPPVDGCDIVTVGSHAPFFFFPNCTFILYLFLTSLVVKHWWWQANVRSESYFSFPPPHIVTLPPVSIFIFQNVLPLVLYLPHSTPTPPPPLMSFPTSFLPQRLSHSTSTLFLCGFQPSK